MYKNRVGPKRLDKVDVDNQLPFGRTAGPLACRILRKHDTACGKSRSCSWSSRKCRRRYWYAVTDRGVARLDVAAARFIKRANAPWARRREKIENGVFSAEWRAAQGEVHGEDEQ